MIHDAHSVHAGAASGSDGEGVSVLEPIPFPFCDVPLMAMDPFWASKATSCSDLSTVIRCVAVCPIRTMVTQFWKAVRIVGSDTDSVGMVCLSLLVGKGRGKRSYWGLVEWSLRWDRVNVDDDFVHIPNLPPQWPRRIKYFIWYLFNPPALGRMQAEGTEIIIMGYLNRPWQISSSVR